MTDIQIDSDIPVPEKRGSGITHILRQLKVGDSVFLPGKTVNSIGGLKHLAGLTGKTTTRTLVENGIKGCRVWRTK